MAASGQRVTLGKSVGMVIYRRLDEVRELPAPGSTWQWSRVECGGGTLQYLKRAGLIVQDCDGDGWRTSRRLARFLEARHGVELGRSGQTSLGDF